MNGWLVCLWEKDWVSVCDGVKMDGWEYEMFGLLEIWINFRDRKK